MLERARGLAPSNGSLTRKTGRSRRLRPRRLIGRN